MIDVLTEIENTTVSRRKRCAHDRFDPYTKLGFQVSICALGAAIDVSSKQLMEFQTNKYLDNMNEQLLKPRGPYVSIMSFEPDSTHVGEFVDVNIHIVQSGGSRISGHRSEGFRISSGTTHGELELPQAASLVFPDPNGLPEDQRANTMNKTGFLDDYLDRRAQAKYESQNRGQKLAVPRPSFVSSWSDPTASVYSANILRELMGGPPAE